MRRASTSYTPRRPHDTVLHRLVREHYATFVAHTEATYAAPLPRYVTDAFERYLGALTAAALARYSLMMMPFRVVTHTLEPSHAMPTGR